MAAIMARPLPLGRVLRPPSRIGSSIPSVYHRVYSSKPKQAPRKPRPQQQKGMSASVWIQSPKLEAPLPPEVRVDAVSLALQFGGRRWNYVYSSLRDSCKCPICVDPHSKQRNFRMTDIPVDVSPRRVDFNGQELVIQWRNDIPGFDASHTSTYDIEMLTNVVGASTQGIGFGRTRKTWNARTMEQLQFWISYEDYMNDKPKFAEAMKNLSRAGLIFIKDIPDSREEVEKIATRIGPLRNTFYGPTWDVRKVPDAENVAYTNQFLDFHMDLMYMQDPPGYQLLHCLENSCEGGESMFCDAIRAAKIVAGKRPDYFKILSESNLSYEYNHEGAMYYNRWPVIESGPPIGERAVPNIKRVNYSPPFQAPIFSQPLGKDFIAYSNFLDALNYFVRILQDNRCTFELKLQPGQCVLFENRRVVHARRQFNTSAGHRWLAGAYLDEDTLLSRFRITRREHPDIWNARKLTEGQEDKEMVIES